MAENRIIHFGSWFRTNLLYYNIYAILTASVFTFGLPFELIGKFFLGFVFVISAYFTLRKRKTIKKSIIISAFIISSLYFSALGILMPAAGEEIYPPAERIMSSLIVEHARAGMVYLLFSAISILIFLARFVWENRKDLNHMQWD